MVAVASQLPPESLASSQTTDTSQSALFTALNRVGNSLLGTGVLTSQDEEAVRQRQLQALVMGYGNAQAAAGLGTRSLQGVKALAAGADMAIVIKVESLAQEAIAANVKLSRSTNVADGPYEAPVHTSTNTFQTHGLALEQVPSGVRNQLAQDLTGGAGVGKLEEIIQSGKTIPIPSLATSETKLYRIQVEGRDFNSQSVYYMDAAQLQRVQGNPQLLQDLLGLPPNSKGIAYTIYERQPLAGQTPTIYQSNIATVTTDTGGKSVGAGNQTILPNSKLWSKPTEVGTVRIKE